MSKQCVVALGSFLRGEDRFWHRDQVAIYHVRERHLEGRVLVGHFRIAHQERAPILVQLNSPSI